MLIKMFFLHTVCLNIPVFTLFLKRFVLAPVSLRPQPEKAQSTLIGQRFQVLSYVSLHHHRSWGMTIDCILTDSACVTSPIGLWRPAIRR